MAALLSDPAVVCEGLDEKDIARCKLELAEGEPPVGENGALRGALIVPRTETVPPLGADALAGALLQALAVKNAVGVLQDDASCGGAQGVAVALRCPDAVLLPSMPVCVAAAPVSLPSRDGEEAKEALAEAQLLCDARRALPVPPLAVPPPPPVPLTVPLPQPPSPPPVALLEKLYSPVELLEKLAVPVAQPVMLPAPLKEALPVPLVVPPAG